MTICEELRERGVEEGRRFSVALSKISSLLCWTQVNLPSSSPAIISQAAYVIAVQTVSGNPISLKALISTLGCSEAGLRRPLQRLLDEGWVVIFRDEQDQRVRRVLATEKLLDGMVRFASRIMDHQT